VVVAACGRDQTSSADAAAGSADLFYAWDGRSVLCSDPVDDLEGVTRDWSAEQARFAEAAQNSWVTLVHAHKPGQTVSTAALERVFGWADEYHLDYVRFDELDPAHGPRPGLAFAFDDDDVTGWLSVRDILQAHHARVTFFITRWFEISGSDKAGIATLAADGHDIEPHTVHRLDAQDYVGSNGLSAYIADEVVPSITDLTDAGYAVTSFAYPFGAHDDAIDQAVLALPQIHRVRTTPGECPGAAAGNGGE
jgi:peptidoglycan/xylan/chitin deacetylase (PgdA/CDA1 family)